MNLFPDVARFTFQAGRAAASRRDDDRAMVLYREASEAGSAAGTYGVAFCTNAGGAFLKATRKRASGMRR